MEYFLHVNIMIGIYIILAVSLNLIAGYAGLLSIAHAAFYGLGAYVTGIMALAVQGSFVVNVLSAVSLSAIVGALLSVPSLRVRGDYFVIVTFAFQTIVFSVLNNWVTLTGGPMGLAGIPRPTILGWEIATHSDFLVLTIIICAVVLLICHKLVNSPFGRVLKAIRENEMIAISFGKDVTLYKVLVFMIGAGVAAIAGALYAYYVSFIDPTSFTLVESILLISIVVIGGAGSFWGPVLAAVILVSVPELLRFVGLPSIVAANVRQIVYGALLVTFMLWRPQGLLGDYGFGK